MTFAPDDELDPVFDAVGRLVNACQFLELFLYLAVSSLVPGYSMFDAEKKLKPKGCIAKLRVVADQLPDPERTELIRALDDAGKALEARYQVVHGVHGPTATPGVRMAMRTSMTERDSEGMPESIRGRLTRESILADRDRARSTGGLLQASLGRWAEMLGLDDDEDQHEADIDAPPEQPR